MEKTLHFVQGTAPTIIPIENLNQYRKNAYVQIQEGDEGLSIDNLNQKTSEFGRTGYITQVLGALSVAISCITIAGLESYSQIKDLIPNSTMYAVCAIGILLGLGSYLTGLDRTATSDIYNQARDILQEDDNQNNVSAKVVFV